MKICIVESEINFALEKREALVSFVKPIFDQGHNVMLITKDSLLEHLDAHILLFADSTISFAGVVKLFLAAPVVPEFVGIVSELRMDSLHRSNNKDLNALLAGLSFGFVTLAPEQYLDSSTQVVCWQQVYDFVAQHFKLVFTVAELKSHLSSWAQDYKLQYKNICQDQRVVAFLKEIDNEKCIAGLANDQNDIFISNDQWKKFNQMINKIFQQIKAEQS